MTTRALLWGDGYENTLVLGELYNPVTDRPERAGSSHDTDGAGADVAWLEGRDYTLDADIRWVPDVPGGTQTPISGPVAFQAFLDWSRNAGVFRFVPDVTVPAFYLDNCYLVEPRKGFGSFENIKRSVHLTIRNPSIDFHLALRGLMFEWAPGANLTALGMGASFARASVGRYRSLPGGLQLPLGASAGANVFRDRNYWLTTRAAIVAGQRTQLLSAPEDFSAWTLSGATRTGGQADPFGGTSAWLIDSTTPSASDGILSPIVTFTGDGTKLISWFLRQGTATTNRVRLIKTNGTPANRITVDIAWSGGVPTPSIVGGGGTGLLWPAEPWGAGWYQFTVTADSVLAADTNRIDVFADQNAGGGTVYAFGVNAHNVPVWAPYQETAATTNSDVLTFPFPWKPQAMFLYAEFIEGGQGALIPGAVNFPGVVCVGSSANGTLDILNKTGDARYASDHYNLAGVGVEGGATHTLPTPGQTVRVLSRMSSTGAVTFGVSIDGGAEVAGSASAANPLDATWGAAIIQLGARRGPVYGYNPLLVVKAGPLTALGVTVDTIPKAAAL